MLPMASAIARPFAQSRRIHCSRVLGREDVNLRFGEVGQAACVSEIHMRDDQMAHVADLESEPFDLSCCSLFRIETRASDRHEMASESSLRLGYISQTNSGIDQQQSVVSLYKKTMTD